MLGALCLYLVLELGLFLVVKAVIRVTTGDLVGPYLAFAVPAVICLLLAWRLKRWEEHGPSSRLLALGWSLGTVFLFSTVIIAFFYSGLRLHFLNLGDAKGFIAVAVVGVPIAFFIWYRVVLSHISARAARNVDDPSHEIR